MFRKRLATFAVAAAAGTMLLTACNSGDTGAASSAPGSAAAPAAGQPGTGNLSLVNGSAKQNNAPADTGDFANQPGKPTVPAGMKWVQLSASKAGALDPVVVDGAGFTLYRFDNDTASPSKSNCDGDCAVTWPPAVVDPQGKVFVDGVDPSVVGSVTRTDGTQQVTIGGWPVYRFSKDLKPGDTNGQGVKGTWFGVTPDGQKAGRPGGQPTAGQAGTGQANGDANSAPATGAVLFDDKNFADNGSQGLAGQGCQNVTRDNVASSVQAAGSLKIWSEANCTGNSKIISGNVADLATIGFDDDITSVFFG